MRISVVGGGYVGLVTATCLASLGHDCVVIELDADRVAQLNRGEAPIHEAGLDELLARVNGTRFRATTDLRAAVLGTELTFVAVGTPFDGARIDLSQVLRAVGEVGRVLAGKPAPHTVVVKSTVVPGTTDAAVRPELERASGKRAGHGFGLGVNPEFLTEGVAVDDFLMPDRIVLGGDAIAIAALREVYASFTTTPLIVTSNATAEMIKYTSNALLATLISFSNEIANLCSAVGGVDIVDVMRGVHESRYLTTRRPGAEPTTAPIASFLWAGCGYGGSCLPKDTKALSSHGVSLGQPMPLLDAVIATNAGQPARMLGLLERDFASLAGVETTVLGLAFKEGTDDVREATALPIVRELVARGARVTAYDPIAMRAAQPHLPAGVRYAPSLRDAVTNAQAILVCTRWREFEELASLVAERDPPPLVVDGRRMLPREKFRRYAGIGL